MNPAEVNERLNGWYDRVVIDNDFERACQIPFDKFNDISREDLIETLYIAKAIMAENEIMWPESGPEMGPQDDIDDEPANRQFPDM